MGGHVQSTSICWKMRGALFECEMPQSAQALLNSIYDRRSLNRIDSASSYLSAIFRRNAGAEQGFCFLVVLIGDAFASLSLKSAAIFRRNVGAACAVSHIYQPSSGGMP